MKCAHYTENVAVMAIMAQHGSALAWQSVICNTMKVFLQERKKSGWVMPVCALTRVNEPDDSDDAPPLSTTHTATLSGDGDDMEAEDRADEVDEGELYHQEDNNADVDTAAFNIYIFIHGCCPS